ncbi:MAG: phosphoribosylanthranilate isomerase [Acidimicrobiia bacterium]|nr:phosphoribosylanthranilate isomerase [Acidimicrobiia bacterium]NNF09783.1 phosphoribosylanthranilate isomerase [Acidimicrobiia bacterium]NNL68920.1 phosphoribosylanthranilate isomerase [Acidimicrobiia bacterium]
MTWVKVCGLRTVEAVEAAQENGVDAVGLVFAPASPRHVTVEHARELVEVATVLTVAVTVDLDADSLLHLAETTGVGAVQPHGANAAAAARAALAAGLPVLRPVSAGEIESISGVSPEELPLIDSDAIGGTGRTFDWSTIPPLERRFVLAGGLGVDNVADAIGAVKPWGVDASSRLESAPGIKDLALVGEFIRRAKQA